MARRPTPTVVFGKRLRSARKAAGLRLVDVSDALGFEDQNSGAPTISKYERGLQMPRPEVAQQLADALEVPLAYFYAGDDAMAEMIRRFALLDRVGRVRLMALLEEKA